MKGLFERVKSARSAGEEGMALAGVVMLSAFVFIVVSSLMMTSIISTQLTADNRSSLLTVSSAESGIDDALVAATKGACSQSKTSDAFGYSYKVYRSGEIKAPLNITDVGVSAGCPQDGDKYIIIKSLGTDYRGKKTEIVSTYQWITKADGTVDGAIISGSAIMNLSRINITKEGADLVLMSGNFDCNNVTSIAGDLIVLNGIVKISNACTIKGSIYSAGSVTINNPAVAVGGNVHTLGDFSASTGAVINGSIYAKGNLTLSSGVRVLGNVTGSGTALTSIDNVSIDGSLTTAGSLKLQSGSIINGSVSSSNTAASNIYNVTINGSLTSTGSFASLQTTKVGGIVKSVRAGATNSIAPDVISGSIYLGGTISTWGAGPEASVTQNMTMPAPAAPIFEKPYELMPGSFVWRDYKFKASDWSGYQMITPLSCNYQTNASLVAQVTSFIIPTIVDLRGCSKVILYGVTLSLKTDVTFLANTITNAQNLSVVSANGNKYKFNFFISDEVANSSPTCSANQGVISMYGMKMSSDISGFIYSPCTVTFGGDSTINGQIYAGIANYSGGGSTELAYSRMGMPGFPSDKNEVNVNYKADATSRTVPRLVERKES